MIMETRLIFLIFYGYPMKYLKEVLETSIKGRKIINLFLIKEMQVH